LDFIGTLAVLFTVVGHRPPLGVSTIAFLAVGIVPYLTFYVRVQSAVSAAVRSNLSLLYFRQVTPLVLIAAAFVREYLTALVIFIIIAGGIAVFDKTVQISDPLEILMALTCISLLGAVVGTFFGLGELVFPSLQLAEIVVFRIMFFFSGALYFANQLPPQMRQYALLNPLLHLIEFVRDGYLSVYHSRYANWHYPLQFIAVGFGVVVVLLHSTRRYVVAK
jgi:capsular polysaccharide transport system permease protein